MAMEYSPSSSRHPVNSSRCKAAVHNAGRWPGFHQCSRKPWKDGWCKQHHPDTEAQRAKERDERYQQRHEKSAAVQLARLKENHEVILYQRDELLKVCKLAEYHILLRSYDKDLHDNLTCVIALVEGD